MCGACTSDHLWTLKTAASNTPAAPVPVVAARCNKFAFGRRRQLKLCVGSPATRAPAQHLSCLVWHLDRLLALDDVSSFVPAVDRAAIEVRTVVVYHDKSVWCLKYLVFCTSLALPAPPWLPRCHSRTLMAPISMPEPCMWQSIGPCALSVLPARHHKVHRPLLVALAE